MYPNTLTQFFANSRIFHYLINFQISSNNRVTTRQAGENKQPNIIPILPRDDGILDNRRRGCDRLESKLTRVNPGSR